MRIEDCFVLGSITRTHGNKGGLVLVLETDQADQYKKLESVLLNINEELIPFFIKSLAVLKQDQFLITLEEIGQDEARQLLGTEVYLPLTHLPKLSGKQFYYHEVAGFTAIDKTAGTIGTIDYVLERAVQPVFVIAQGETEFYVPAIDEFIIEINRSKKEVHLDCPEGLLDIYRQG
jgi:16S rRNA processing protein RimM